MVHVRKRKNSPYYFLHYKDLSGKWKKKSTGTKNFKIATLQASNLELKLERIKLGLEPHEDNKITIDNFFNKIIHHIETRKTKLTAKTYLRHLKNLKAFIDTTGYKYINNLTVIDIEEYITERLRKASAITVNHELDTFRTIIKFAIRQKLLTENIILQVDRPTITNKPPFFYTKEQLKEIFMNISERFKPFYLTLLHTGVRPHEFILFTWEDFDFSNKTVYVRTKEGSTDIKMRSRSIPLHEKVEWSIKERMKLKESDKWVFTTLQGEKFKDHILRKLWQKAVKQAGLELEKTDIRSLRHTFASHLVSQGESIYKVSEWLGHTSIVQTQIYAHLIPSDDDYDSINSKLKFDI